MKMVQRSGDGSPRRGWRRGLLAATALAGCAVLLPTAIATGAPGAKTTVTIKAEGTDVFGYVRSPNAERCADDREIIVFKQRGRRGGGDDEEVGRDNASLNGNRYMWSTGNAGLEGRFYARARRVGGCKPDSSDTIRVEREDDEEL